MSSGVHTVPAPKARWDLTAEELAVSSELAGLDAPVGGVNLPLDGDVPAQRSLMATTGLRSLAARGLVRAQESDVELDDTLARALQQIAAADDVVALSGSDEEGGAAYDVSVYPGSDVCVALARPGMFDHELVIFDAAAFDVVVRGALAAIVDGAAFGGAVAYGRRGEELVGEELTWTVRDGAIIDADGSANSVDELADLLLAVRAGTAAAG